MREAGKPDKDKAVGPGLPNWYSIHPEIRAIELVDRDS